MISPTALELREMDLMIANHVMGFEYPVASMAKWYHLDIAEAWKVVAKMREKGFHFLLMATHESELAIASFYLGPHDRTDNSATELFKDAPRAICRAALNSLERTV